VVLEIPVYVARPRPDRFEASMPWIEALAEPVRGSNALEPAEDVLLRAVRDLYEQPADTRPSLLPPDDLALRDLDLTLEHRPNPNRPAHSIDVGTRVLVGRLRGSKLLRIWIPRVPGVSLAVETPDDVPSTVQNWAEAWLADDETRVPDQLEVDHPGRLETFELDLDVAAAEEGDRPPGRLRLPETLRRVATRESARLADTDRPRAFGRDRLVESVVDAMAADDAVSLALIGPSGAGKSAILEEAVRRLGEREYVYQKRCDVWRTSGERIVGAADRDEDWTQLARRAFEETAQRCDVLAIEDLGSCLGTGADSTGALDLGAIVEPLMEERELAVIAETTSADFDEVKTRWPGVASALQRLRVPALDADASLEVANAWVRSMESELPIDVTPDGVEAALDFAERYDRRDVAPGKVVRLLRRCLHEATHRRETDGDAAASDRRRTRIDADAVAEVVHRQTGLPMRILQHDAGRAADAIQTSFESRVFDQPEASEAVTDLIVSVEHDLTDPRRPHGSLLLIGPTGVGKTETAKALADELFGTDDRLVRFDMSEFADAEAASRFVGTAEHPEGELTGRVRARPFCVLLFDEIEKAHRRARDALLQVLEEGRMTDASGRTVDFCNTVIVLTSNLGDEEERQAADCDRSAYDRRAAESFFRPEFFNRLDRLVSYEPLDVATFRRIARRTLRELLDRRGLRRLQVMIDFDPDLIEHLAEAARAGTHGARTLARGIERELTAPLARRLAGQRADSDDVTRVRLSPEPDGGLELDLRTLHRPDAGTVEPSWRTPEVSLGREAPSVPPAPIPEGEEPSAEAVDTRFHRLIRHLRVLETSEAVERLEREYEETLETINARAASDEPISHDLGERLRQHEIVRNGLDTLLEQLDDRLLPEEDEAPGGFAMSEAGPLEEVSDEELTLPDFAAMRREQLHEWADDYVDLYHDWLWLRHQLGTVLETSLDAATLVVRGLSGPHHRILNHWYRLLGAFADSRGIELVAIGSDGEHWHRCESDVLPGSISTVTMSAEHPGVGEAFRRLLGYTWAPDPSAGGRHALALTEGLARGTSDVSTLMERRRAWSAGAADSDDGDSSRDERSARDGDFDTSNPRVEFVVESGYLRDVRREWHRTIPERTGHSMERFADTWILRRLTM
jgi:ATP-dependent Clp protease ATP-binding subunit ClpA